MFTIPRIKGGKLVLKNGMVIDCCCESCDLPPLFSAQYQDSNPANTVQFTLTYDVNYNNPIGELGAYIGEFAHVEANNGSISVELFYNSLTGEWQLDTAEGPTYELHAFEGDYTNRCIPAPLFLNTQGEFSTADNQMNGPAQIDYMLPP